MISVTLNYQTEDIPNFYNWVQFSENGHSGYLLKPEIFRNPSIQFDPNAAISSSKSVQLTVQVISGQHLPKAPGKSEVVDPYVEVRVSHSVSDQLRFARSQNSYTSLFDCRLRGWHKITLSFQRK